MEPPFPFDHPDYVRHANNPEFQALWELLWRHIDVVLPAIQEGRGALGALPKDEVLKINPDPDRAFLTTAGVQMSLIAQHYGYKPEGKQTLHGSLWKKVARFKPRTQDETPAGTEAEREAPVQAEQLELTALKKRVTQLEEVVARICDRLGLDPTATNVVPT